MSKLFLPGHEGAVDSRVWRCDQAAREYDSRLRVGQNQDNGQWCVFIQLERGSMPELHDMYPIFGLGHDPAEFPHPDDLKKRLYQSDTVRHGDEMLQKMNYENERRKAELQKPADEATMQAAEAFEWGIRRMSNDIGKRRIQINMGEKAIHRHRSST